MCARLTGLKTSQCNYEQLHDCNTGCVVLGVCVCVWCVHALCKRDVLCVCYAVVCCADECVYVSQTAMHVAGISMCMRGFVWVCVSVSPCMHMCVHVCICVHVPVCACVYICVHIYKLACMLVYACVCVCTCIRQRGTCACVSHGRKRECASVHLYVYACAHVYRHTWMHVWTHTSKCASVFACLQSACESVRVSACLQGAWESVSVCMPAGCV